MKHIKLYNEHKDVDVDVTKLNFFNKNDISDDEIEKRYLITLGKKGELIKYLKEDTIHIKFGVFKSIFNDAILYKKRREYIKGGYKFVHRTIPMLLGPVIFPVWLIGKILGTSRAINKIIKPVLQINHKSYNSFLTNLITKTMNVMEGDIRFLLHNDWFYSIFYIEPGLINMVRKEYFLEFADFLSNKISKEDDDKIVPKFYVENHFRIWLNNKFNLNPPLILKSKNKNIKRS